MAPRTLEAAVQAAVAGDLRLVREMATVMDLRRGRGRNGRNMLHFAATAGVLDFCRFLVEESGFDPNSLSAEGETPILTATEADVDGDGAGIVPVLRYLLERGGDPAKPDARGCTPLHNAAEQGYVEVVKLLLSKGVPVDPLEHRGTPLHLAALNDNDQVLKVLLENGADPKGIDRHVFSPLFLASFSRSFKCFKLLVEAGADVDFRGPTGQTVLFDAVAAGLTDLVKFLLEAGADPNIHDGYGRFPIILAAANEQRELVEILLPRTKPIPSVPDWSADGIIRASQYLQFEPQELRAKRIADAKAQGKTAFARENYVAAVYCYMQATEVDQHDATLFSNMSLCWLRLGQGESALACARKCKALRPDWSKAWYREGVALSLLKNYIGAVDALHRALKLDPGSNEIKKALREADEAQWRSLFNGESS